MAIASFATIPSRIRGMGVFLATFATRGSGLLVDTLLEHSLGLGGEGCLSGEGRLSC